jgi:hypothetical protein
MYRFFLILTFAVWSPLFLWAGIVDTSAFRKDVRDLELTRQLWLQTRNAAGMSLMPVKNGGTGEASVGKTGGDFNRVQEGNATNTFSFTADHYDNLKDSVYFYGKFSFDMSRQFGRSWSDVFETYNADPYIYGSSVKGKYDLQLFDLFTKIATRPIGRFTFGVQADYSVGSLARLRDPRSLTNLADYYIIPAMTYRLSDSQIAGLSLTYRHRKEKTPGITTVQTDPSLKYYTFTGMENVIGTIGGYSSFKREFTSNILGAALNYSLTSGAIHSLNTFSYDYEHENVWGVNKHSPGAYREKTLQFTSYNTLESEHHLNLLEITAEMVDGKADEFRQQQVYVTDSTTSIVSTYWKTLYTYKGRYHVTTANLSAHYCLYFLNEADGYDSWLGCTVRYQKFTNQYNLPVSSLKVSTVSGQIEGSRVLFRKGSRALWLNASLTYLYALNAALNLQDETTDYAEQVLIPDLEYYQSSYLNGGGSLQYYFPLQVKRKCSTVFLRIYGDNTFASSSENKWGAGISFGIVID